MSGIKGRLKLFLARVLPYTPLLSLLCCFASYALFGLFPDSIYNEPVYISERALLPNYSWNSFSKLHAETIPDLTQEIIHSTNHTDSTMYTLLSLNLTRDIGFFSRDNLIINKLRDLGLQIKIHEWMLTDRNRLIDSVFYTNIYAIFKSPRADGTESMIIGASKSNINNVQNNALGIAFTLALVEVLSKEMSWSKDIILLFPSMGSLGIKHWLEVFHGESSPSLISDKEIDHLGFRRSGAIQAALMLEFDDLVHLGNSSALLLHSVGMNGLMPNLDLVNIIKNSGPIYETCVTLNENFNTNTDHYFLKLQQLVQMMIHQAFDDAPGTHGPFLKYRIDSVTLSSAMLLGCPQLKYHKVAEVIEATLRSINTLIEHFHQSFFFYILPNNSRYVSIGMYMPCIFLFVAALLIKAFWLWASIYFKTKRSDSSNGKRKKAILASFIIVFYSMMLSSFILFLIGFYPFRKYLILRLLESSSSKLYPVGVLFFIIGSPIFFSNLLANVLRKLDIKDFIEDDIAITRSILLQLSGFLIFSLSCVNFSLAFFIAAVFVCILLYFKPVSLPLMNFVQLFILTLLHPGTLFLLVNYENIGSKMATALDNFVEGSWLLWLLCLHIIPILISYQSFIIVFSILRRKDYQIDRERLKNE